MPADATALQPPAPNPEPRSFTHQGDPNQAYALIGWSTLGGATGSASAARWRSPPTCSRCGCSTGCARRKARPIRPNASHLSSETFPAWGIFYAAAEVRPGSAADLLPHRPRDRRRPRRPPGAAGRVRAGAESGDQRHRAAAGDQRLLARRARELGATAERDIENVRSYLADYRALTAEDVRRAVATYVTEQGDWSMLVLPR